MMSFYDSIAAERTPREDLQAFADETRPSIWLSSRAELQVSFLDSIAAEERRMAETLEALVEQHDLDLFSQGEMQMGFYTP